MGARALEAGRHVLCEKPVDADPRVVDDLFAVAQERGLVFTEAFMWRHLPQTQVLCELLAQGAVGELRMIRVWSGFMLERDGDPRLDPGQQGGALMDIGCYCVSAARLLAGEPEAVTAQCVREAGRPGGVDMRVAATMRFPRDVLAHFDCAFDLPMGFGLHVAGSEAVIEVDDPWFGVDARDPRAASRRRRSRRSRRRPSIPTAHSWRTSQPRSRTAASHCWTARRSWGRPTRCRHCSAQ